MGVVGPAAGGHIMFVTRHTYNLHTMQQQFEDAHVVCFPTCRRGNAGLLTSLDFENPVALESEKSEKVC